ncbi:hypothetical protein [Chitinophaga japonensis]|uniref:Curli production assembly/transport component CsgE n=1 Tax=Chitinophaga japonensis TaxID=104662 RepID=A0A562SYU7_CHIJA|nr:hypothetical protein [Chitinophaga japonensis]TWI86343.1 hypothetical protein LX66_3597 [Chitinophaga japonensis]
MKKIILLALILLPGAAFAQKFYVEKSNNGAEQVVINKLLERNFKVTFRADSADYIIRPNIVGKSMGRAKGNILIINSKTGSVVASTKEMWGSARITNGFDNPTADALRKICKKYLERELTKITESDVYSSSK